jgi:hypothetical protein
LRCIVDTNLLTDLNNGSKLTLLFQLPIEAYAPDLVVSELAEPVKEHVISLGLRLEVLTADQLFAAADMQASKTYLSLSDCAAYLLARNTGSTLLTGATRLRELAIADGISAYDSYWVVEQCELTRLLTGPEALHTINLMLSRSYL